MTSNIINFDVIGNSYYGFTLESTSTGQKYFISHDQFEQYLMSINRVGSFDCEFTNQYFEVSYKDALKDKKEVFDMLDDILTMSTPLELMAYEKPEPVAAWEDAKHTKSQEIYDNIGFPEFDQYAAVEGRQRPMIEEKYLLNNL